MNATLRNWLYSLSLTPGLVVVYGNLHGGVWSAANVLYSLVILGLVEVVTKNFSSQEHTGSNDTIPNLILWLHVPLQIACILSFMYGVKNEIIADYHIWYAAMSMSVYTGSGAIVVAHEFIHRKGILSQWAGKFLLFTAGNFYFFIEHLRVHHKWVGTGKDSATAKRGQSVYGFFVTSGWGQIKSAWKLETERCRREGKAARGVANYMVRQLLYHVLFDAILLVILGPLALAAWFVHCLLANFLLEYVNYIEHYGLVRSENERVNELHSWQTDKFVSRFILVDLSRHADHHYYAAKPFHTLTSYEKSPVLPGGYASLIIPALFPPVWRKITHPILDRIAHL
ncbi:MAG: alkane 1-monooxygenase [Bacteroidota bacterium]